jgi:ubiquinone biosynthesis protein
LLQKTLLYVEGLGRQLYPQLDLWTTAKPFLESWIRDQVGLPAMVRAFKERAPFWIEKLPELPELVYDSLKQHQLMQHNIEKLTNQLQTQNERQGQSRYLFGVGATLLISGTVLMLGKVEIYPVWLIAAGLVSWIIGWRRTGQTE